MLLKIPEKIIRENAFEQKKKKPRLSAYRPSNNQERITQQGGQKNAKNTFATAIHTDQGPEKRCGTYKTVPIVRLFNQFSIECSTRGGGG